MTVGEIFNKVSARQINGMMFHEQLANYFDFLDLNGYKRCQEYHYLEETISHRKTNRYFINNADSLIPEVEFNNESAIPTSWYKYTRHDVDVNTRKNAVKNAFQMWYEWELATRDVYEEAYDELMKLGEVAHAFYIGDLILDVNEELKQVNRKLLELKAVDYSSDFIFNEQAYIHDKYLKLTSKVGEKLC